MRVCIINEFFYPDNTGGTGTVLSQLVRHLKDQHDDLVIDVITTRSLYRGEKTLLSLTETWQGVNISRIGVPRPRNAKTSSRLVAGWLFSIAALLKLMKRRRYDVVLVTTAPPTLPLTMQWMRVLRVPYIYVIYDLFPDVPVALGMLDPKSRIARLCEGLQRKWLRNAHSVVVLGRCMSDHLMSKYEVAQDRIEVIPIWSSDRSIQSLSKATRFREQNQLNEKVVLYAGNFGQCQDFDNLLDAAAILNETDREIKIVFVGEGPKKEHLLKRVEKEKLTNVRVLPFVSKEDFPDLLASADVSLVTLEPGAEGLGVPSKFYNILASGRPTVAVVAPNSEVAQVLEEAHCGLTVAHHDAPALADALRQLCGDEARLDEMGAAARRTFENEYTLEKGADKFHRLFRKVSMKPAKAPREEERAAALSER